jgi:hypothetical protein
MLLGVPFGIDPIWYVEPLTLSEAAALRDNGEALRLIDLGADVNKATTVRAQFVYHNQSILTPLEAAVAARRPDMIQLLLDHGAEMDGRTWKRLMCFADVVTADDVRVLLTPLQPPGAPVSCTDVSTPW